MKLALSAFHLITPFIILPKVFDTGYRHYIKIYKATFVVKMV